MTPDRIRAAIRAARARHDVDGVTGWLGRPVVSDRVAVVTGANRGIGRAIAAALGRDGFAVAVTARDPSRRWTGRCGTSPAAVAGRSRWPATCATRLVAALAEAAGALGPVHTVVANAGVAGPTAPMHEISLAEWRDCLTTDLDGVFLTFRAFVPALIAAGAGSLIAISSMTGKRPLHGRTPYAAAKMGVIGLVRTLAARAGSTRDPGQRRSAPVPWPARGSTT